MALACLRFALAPWAPAQTGDAQRSADVQRLLANDEAVASLRRQLSPKTITNVGP